MKWNRTVKVIFVFALGVLCPLTLLGQVAVPTPKIEGVWEAKRFFGPAVEGPLDIVQQNGKWRAQIAQFNVAVNVKGNRFSLELPDGQGRFEGFLAGDRSSIRGHWIQTPNSGASFSPVVLVASGKDHWRGEVIPLKDEWTLYLVITRKPNGSLSAFIRNPNRNQGLFWYLDRVEQEGNRIKLIGKWLNRGEERVFGEGNHHPDENRLSIYFPDRGGSYDFSRVSNDQVPGFYALGKTQFEYHPPIFLGDGWKTGTLDEVGMSRESITELVKIVNAAPASVHDLDLHGLLVARHGKLVFEEYFHGFHRMQPHDLRSAVKAVASTLVGAVIQSGGRLNESTRVYDLLYKGELPQGIDPRKKEMTVRHLMTMSSGFDCNDWADDTRPGSEDAQWNSPNRNFYSFTLQLPMDSRPGEKPAYCSVDANLLGAVLKSATDRPVQELFQDLIAEPLQIHRYYLGTQPTGEPYLAGGMYFLPRDFIKFAQLMLNGGVWNGKRILSKEFAQRAGSSLVTIEGQKDSMRFGYLWWTIEYPYHGRTIRAYFASGNGGQEAMVIPELDLALAFFGGNYNDRAGWVMVKEYVPKFILAAIKDDSTKTRQARTNRRFRKQSSPRQLDR